MKFMLLRAPALLAAVLLLIAAAAAQESKTTDATKGSESAKSSEAAKSVVAVFRLTGALTETPADDSFPLAVERTAGLMDLTGRMKKAADDKEVKAVVLTVSDLSVGFAQIEEVRQAIAGLRAAGKDVYAHADSLSMPQYVLLCGATQISVVPTGDLWITGLQGESLHVRKLLDLIGAKPDFLTCGAYKSAAELFMRDAPSQEADEMNNWLLDSLYDTSVRSIARGRGVTPEKVRQWIDEGPYTAQKARDAGLIDAVQHRQDFETSVKQRFDGNAKLDAKYGQKEQKAIDLSSPLGILNFYGELLGSGKKVATSKDSIAIVYVEGPIVLGAPTASPLDLGGAQVAASTPIRSALNKAAADDSINAVVLRVNSPGGSAVASEIILDATKRVKAKKPLVVSMGNVAGSGGYYVACGADTIFADEGTITGSIGVVAGKLATQETFGKVGITWKEYNRGANAGLLSTSSTFTAEERKKLQGWMDDIYGVFKGHVTAIRGSKLKKPIDELAGGRVFTGKQALDLGLVDKIGTLDDAVKFVAKEAKIDKYELRVVPEPKNFLELLLESPGGAGDEDSAQLTTHPAAAREHGSILNAALPYLRGMDPQRVDSVLRAFQQLQILEEEGVVLMTPEILVR
ncbi:MAG: signal peptide peptidase SppA [Planctomycetaceae bacterium]|nr:signal peptide peptidase SppA [Planctomycetaceae bacterium]